MFLPRECPPPFVLSEIRGFEAHSSRAPNPDPRISMGDYSVQVRCGSLPPDTGREELRAWMEERFGEVALLEMCEDNDEAIKMYEDKAALTSRQQQLIARSKHAGFSCRCRHLLIYQAPACFTLIRSQSLLLCRPVLTEEDPKYAGPFASELTDIGAQIAAKEEQIWIEMMRRDPEMLRSVSMEES